MIYMESFKDFLTNYIFLLLSILLYCITLKNCTGTDRECLDRFKLGDLKKAVYILILSSFFLIIHIFNLVITFKKYNKDKNKNKIINRYYNVAITISLIFYITFVYDTGADFKSHGAYNRIIFFVFDFLFTIIFLSFIVIYKLSLLKKIVVIFNSLVILIYIYVLYEIKFSAVIQESCSDWYNGFKNSKLINSSDNSCIIRKPKICYFRLLYGFFDASKVTGHNCEKLKKNNFLLNKEYLNTNILKSKLIGFPRTEKWPILTLKDWNVVQKNVLSNLIDIDSLPSIEENNEIISNNFSDVKYNEPIIPKTPIGKIEVILDLKEEPKVVIDLKIDSEAIMKKRILRNNPLFKNVLHVFMDSLSRVEWKRKLPKFYKWIEDRYKNKSSVHESFQFFRYHGNGMYTEHNMTVLNFGVFAGNNLSNTHLVKYFNDNGFITGQALNYCGNEIYSIDSGFSHSLDWENSAFDHEFFGLFCDLNFSSKENSYSIINGVNSINTRCIYGKTLLEHSLEYTKQFFEKYKDENKFFRLLTYEGHEGSGEAIKYNDEIYFDFFSKNEKLFEDTIIYIQSDHGLAMLGPYSAFELEDYSKELILPNLFLLLPKLTTSNELNKNHIEKIKFNLSKNEQSLITNFCLRRSFLAIINNEELITEQIDKFKRFPMYLPIDNRYYDLFNQVIPLDRNCNSFVPQNYFNWYMEYCRCDNNK